MKTEVQYCILRRRMAYIYISGGVLCLCFGAIHHIQCVLWCVSSVMTSHGIQSDDLWVRPSNGRWGVTVLAMAVAPCLRLLQLGYLRHGGREHIVQMCLVAPWNSLLGSQAKIITLSLKVLYYTMDISWNFLLLEKMLLEKGFIYFRRFYQFVFEMWMWRNGSQRFV